MYEIGGCEKKYEEDLKKLWLDICIEEYGFEDWREEIEKVEYEKYEKMLIAIDNDRVVGSMGYINKGNNVAEIKRVYVYSEYRGTGMAQKFFEIIMEDIIKNGYEKIVVQTWSKFDRAIRFYRKNNFVLAQDFGNCYNYERIL